MNSTALGAENTKKESIIFISEAHEKFYYEKLKEVRYQDVYHKALCYSETTVEDRKQITEHEGIFGIEKGDWENERKLRSMQAELSDNEINKEAQLLYSSSDKYGIYQLKHNPELDHLRFEGTESLKRMGITKDNFDAIKPENYELIYVGNLSELQEQTEGETLEAIYEKFNIDHPEDYRGHSLSVSDIVVLHQNGENSAHFVDSFGFTGLPDFIQILEGVKEQEAEIDTSGQDVHKSEPEKQEKETSDNTLEDGDEIIDLGDEKEQVLADMKKSLEIGEETELAFQIADRYISIQEVDGIPAIGINVHRPGEETYMDDEVDLLSGNRIDLEILEHIPSITSEPKAMEVIAELVAKLPEMEIDGAMSEDMEAKVWEKRMQDLPPAEQLAVEIDRFSHDYDVYSYHNNNPNMTESVSEISEMIVQGNTEPITDWLNEVISEGALPEEMQKAK